MLTILPHASNACHKHPTVKHESGVPATVVTNSVEQAAALLRTGGLVAFPTETVYGVGADAFNESAVRKVFEAKLRPADNPLIVHVLDPDQLDAVASGVPDLAARLLAEFAPGPLTVIVPRSPSLPAAVSAGLDSVAVRIPSHPTARALLAAFGGALAAPSANISGRPSPTTWEAVQAELDGRIDGILAGPPSTVGLESTVVDCRGAIPVILRHGSVTAEQIAAAVGVEPSAVMASERTPWDESSPGTRHRHYAPRARVVIVDAASTTAAHTASAEQPADTASAEQPADAATRLGFIGVNAPADPTPYQRIRICRSEEEYASELYTFFRVCEDDGITEIHCARVPPVGLGRALMDRLTRAAVSTV